jgi:hypothetical protein
MSFGRSPKIPQASLDQLNWTQQAMSRLSRDLVQRPGAEAQKIESYQKQLFEKLSQAIHESADASLSRTQSNLAKRFGGSISSTFGTDLLSRIEKQRMQSISDAQLDASLTGYQLANELDQMKTRKLSALQGQFSHLSSQMHNSAYMREALRRQKAGTRNEYIQTALAAAQLGTKAIKTFF